MVRERPRLSAGPVWNRTCLFCHNTVPLLSTLFGAFAGPHAPHYQGEVVDALLPRDRAEAIRTTDESGLLAAVAREVARLGGEPGASADAPALGRGLRGALRGAIDTTRSRFTGAKLLEVGIGCESCHGGSREHVGDPSVHPSLLPRAPYLALAAEASPAEVEDRACARCHQVLFSRYPWTWEGGRRSAMPGGSHISSGEARDLLLGGCRGALRCSACHDPHAPASTADSARLATLETPRGNEVCLACHSALRLPAALRAHAHHDPTGAGGACIACHMPKKNMSLDGRLSRYHRIGSPTDPDRVLGDRPVECALCHADRTVEDLVHTMEAWWNKQYSREVLRASYGDLGERALVATLRRGKSHEKAVALAVLGGRRDSVRRRRSSPPSSATSTRSSASTPPTPCGRRSVRPATSTWGETGRPSRPRSHAAARPRGSRSGRRPGPARGTSRSRSRPMRFRGARAVAFAIVRRTAASLDGRVAFGSTDRAPAPARGTARGAILRSGASLGLTSDARVTPSDARVTPSDARGMPRDARGMPRDARVTPRDARVMPRDALDLPRAPLVAPRAALALPRGSLVTPRAPLRTSIGALRLSRASMIPTRCARRTPRASLGLPSDPLGTPRDSREVPRDSREVPRASRISTCASLGTARDALGTS